ncbi:hypothetical protein HPQ64_19355 [Rhizobiales bacterium]|uniref:hypothetical protein n=1 Tax=Hongsoonwoonella zoysiae TaxID=2821844 RepID=UPI0015605828|nr:hypothetical protein [Hongsoonwoonella zoysiae]NRG19856.1 hypothetical protein [Hongsoonwoonella zoysiae]
MLEAIVLTAEAGVFAWFSVFTLMLASMARESMSMPKPRLDVVGRALIGNARAALATGMVVLCGLAVWEFGLV